MFKKTQLDLTLGKKTILAPIGRDPTRFDTGKNPLLAPIRRGGSVLGSLVGDVKCQATEFSSNLKLQDDNFVRQQLQCVLNQGPCDNIGNTFKRVAPDVLRGRCHSFKSISNIITWTLI